MHGDPEPMAETSGENHRVVVAPARFPRAKRGANVLCGDALLHVLSFLDAREAVQTCVLSKMWCDLWRNVRRINLSSRAFELEASKTAATTTTKGCCSTSSSTVCSCSATRFPWTSSAYILVDNDNDKMFQVGSDEASEWIHHALLCNARSVEVFFLVEKLELNPAWLTSQHLTSLLFFSVVLYTGFFRQLQIGCRALECLTLQDCYIGDIEIASQTIKFLSIGMGCCFPFTHEQASLSLPNLIHLGFFGRPFSNERIPSLKNMQSLDTAYINVSNINGLLADDIRQFVLGLSGVTKLNFCFGKTELMGMNLKWCPKFNNLKFLRLGNWYLDANFYGLIAFLQNSPNLEHLSLDLSKKQVEVPEALMGRPGNRPFTCEHLKTVEISCSEDDHVVNSLMDFMLWSGISSYQIHIKH